MDNDSRMTAMHRLGWRDPRWVLHDRGLGWELSSGCLRARVQPVRTHGAEFMWAVLFVKPSTLPFASLEPMEYDELESGDTIGDNAEQEAIWVAEAALRRREGRR